MAIQLPGLMLEWFAGVDLKCGVRVIQPGAFSTLSPCDRNMSVQI